MLVDPEPVANVVHCHDPATTDDIVRAEENKR